MSDTELEIEVDREFDIDSHLKKEQTEQDLGDDEIDWGLASEKTFMGQPLAVNQHFDDRAAIRFLNHYAKTRAKIKSARLAGSSYHTIRHWEIHSEPFAELIEMAEMAYLEKIEREMYRRGIEGTLEPITSGGTIITWVRKYSDKMLELMAKKADPSGYGNKVDVNQTISGGIVHVPASMGTLELDAEAHGLTIEYVKDDDDAK